MLPLRWWAAFIWRTVKEGERRSDTCRRSRQGTEGREPKSKPLAWPTHTGCVGFNHVFLSPYKVVLQIKMRSLYCDWGWGVKGGHSVVVRRSFDHHHPNITKSFDRHRPNYIIWSSSSQLHHLIVIVLTIYFDRHPPSWPHHLFVIAPTTSFDRHPTYNIISSSSYLSQYLIVILPITSFHRHHYLVWSSSYLSYHLIVNVSVASFHRHTPFDRHCPCLYVA